MDPSRDSTNPALQLLGNQEGLSEIRGQQRPQEQQCTRSSGYKPQRSCGRAATTVLSPRPNAPKSSSYARGATIASYAVNTVHRGELADEQLAVKQRLVGGGGSSKP